MPQHIYRVGGDTYESDSAPADRDEIAEHRQKIEPWLSAVFQSDHFSVLIGSGFTTAIGFAAGAQATGMAPVNFGTKFDAAISKHSEVAAQRAGRGQPNIEDQFHAALSLLDGLKILDDPKARTLSTALDRQLTQFLNSLLATERGIASGLNAEDERGLRAGALLQSFLLSFASRTASRERLHIFTTNYDRLIEHGCDLTGLRIVDRFVGALSPVFRSSRVEVDLHYNPPGIRGEPRYLEGVVRLSKLHGSLDWVFEGRTLTRRGIAFGASDGLPAHPLETVMIYPNPAKDVETLMYPYAELFRDFSSALCRPNSAVVTYGYGFGDDHINRVLADMLSIPSTHLVIIAFGDADGRIARFCDRVGRKAQISLLVGSHFGHIENLVDHYLPKPAIDTISIRRAELEDRRTARNACIERKAESNDAIATSEGLVAPSTAVITQ